jgi:hypothetical protein
MGDPTYDNAADLDSEGIPVQDEPANDDEGIMVPRDHPRAESHWGTTANEERRGESVALRATQELPEVSADDIDERFADDDADLAGAAAGQLLQPGDEDVDLEDTDPSMVASQGAGRRTGDGVALSAEEAAVHITDQP